MCVFVIFVTSALNKDVGLFNIVFVYFIYLMNFLSFLYRLDMLEVWKMMELHDFEKTSACKLFYF